MLNDMRYFLSQLLLILKYLFIWFGIFGLIWLGISIGFLHIGCIVLDLTCGLSLRSVQSIKLISGLIAVGGATFMSYALRLHDCNRPKQKRKPKLSE